MNRILAAAGALALAATLTAVDLRAQQLPAPKAKGGNKALMDDWVRKKRALRDQVVDDLRAKGLLPMDGTVSFEALVKPDPRNPGKVQVMHIKSLSIREKPKAANTNTDPIFAPRSPQGNGVAVEATIPIGGGSVRETIHIVGGKPRD